MFKSIREALSLGLFIVAISLSVFVLAHPPTQSQTPPAIHQEDMTPVAYIPLVRRDLPPTPTHTPTVEPSNVQITGVNDPGKSVEEYLVLYNDGGPQDMTGWYVLNDDEGFLEKRCDFPAGFIFGSDTEVRMWSVAIGTTNETNIYCRNRRELWTSGDNALLIDNNEQTRSTYTIP